MKIKPYKTKRGIYWKIKRPKDKNYNYFGRTLWIVIKLWLKDL